MLADYSAMPTLAVSDAERARDFYEGLLGFTPQGDAADGVVYKAGSGAFLVYPSSYAGTNKATAMAIRVDAESFDAEVADLRAKGVEFQTFEMEGITWTDGVASMGDGNRAVWFADPDGNILAVETDTATS